MSAVKKEFQVTLPSNVPGPSTNKPGAYETTLASPLELDGTWEVALMDITYPHTWLDLEKESVIGLSALYGPSEANEDVDIIGEANSIELVKALKNVESYQIRKEDTTQSIRSKYRWRTVDIQFRVKKTFGIVPGKYKLNEILNKLQTEIRSIGAGFENALVQYNKDTDRVSVSETTRKLLISSYTKTSILPMLGFSNDIKTNKDNWYIRNENATEAQRALVESPAYTLVDYIVIDGPAVYEASLPPKVTRLNEIFVYTDIIDTVLIGNTQAPCLGYFPIQSKWGSQAYWNFNPPYYIHVKDSCIRDISIKLCDEKGETVEFESGTVICRLNFRRVGLMRGLF